jgi:uncharacterized membrane protein YoaK (UPF0700 family)
MKDVIFLNKNRFIWFLLALQAGMVNIAGLMTAHRFVSHVTGFAGQFSLHLFHQEYKMALFALLVPLFFLFGAMTSGYYTERLRLLNKEPKYQEIALLIAFVYILVAVLGDWHFLGNFQRNQEDFHDFIILSLLSFNCGSQNALFTNYSYSIVRTTHLTGLTTDLGVGLIKQYCAGVASERKFNRLRTELIFSFLTGSVLGAFLFADLMYKGFYVCFAISFFVAMRLKFTRKAMSHQVR